MGLRYMQPYDYDDVIYLLRLLSDVRDAENGKATFAAQGQAMDGYEALANYQALADKAKNLLHRLYEDGSKPDSGGK